MADTTVNIIRIIGQSDDARTYRIITANSANELPSGDSISFKLVFRDEAGNLIKRTLKDADGNAVTLNAVDDYVVLDYNFLEVE
ncbi:MAG: hypothetical protein II244_00180, partial [Clostridia bacterium]|nr:hypothetical protein [Clostridia bacterium]